MSSGENDKDQSLNEKYKGAPFIILGIAIYLLYQDVVFGLVIISVLLVHELSHAIAMVYFGHEIKKFYFLPFLGAAVESKTKPKSRYESLMISAWGPLGGLISAFISLGFYFLIQYGYIPFLIEGSSIYWKYFYYAFIINAFNLLPIYPLDGGKIAYDLLINKDSKPFQFNLLIALSTVFSVVSTVFLIKNNSLFYVYFFVGLYISGLKQLIQHKTSFIDGSYPSDLPINTLLTPHRGKVILVTSLSLVAVLSIVKGPSEFPARVLSLANSKTTQDYRNYILEKAYGKYISIEDMRHAFKDGRNAKTLENMTSMWTNRCRDKSNFNCRYLGYVSEIKGNQINANSYYRTTCAGGNDYFSCLHILSHKPSKSEKKLAYESLENGCSNRVLDACRTLVWAYDKFEDNNSKVKLVRQKACELGDQSNCYRLGRLPASI